MYDITDLNDRPEHPYDKLSAMGKKKLRIRRETLHLVALLIALVVIALMWRPKPPIYDPLTHRESLKVYEMWNNAPLDVFIRDICYREGVDYKLALAILAVENPRRDPKAVNKNANGTIDYGLFQINSETANPNGYLWHDPFDNTAIAIVHIKYLQSLGLTQFEIVASYNAGVARVRSNNIPQSTVNYTRQVMRIYERGRNEWKR